MRSKIVLSFLLLIITLLSSCAPKLTAPNHNGGIDVIETDRKIAIDPNTKKKAYMARDGAVFNNVFYYSSASLYKYDLTSEKDKLTPVTLCPNPLCQHNSDKCPVYFPGPNIFILEEGESIKNNNSPVFYLMYMERVTRYDSATDTAKLIYEAKDGHITSMWIYDEKIYLNVNNGKDYLLRRIDKNGKNEVTITLSNTTSTSYYIGFDDKYAYCYDLMSNVYRIDFDSKTQDYLFSTDYTFSGKIHNGYMYYGNNKKTSESGEKPFYTCSLYRIKLSDIKTAEPELIDDNIFINYIPIILLSNDKILYVKCTPTKTGEYEYTDSNNNKQTKKIFDDGSDTMYRYDPMTQTTDVAYDSFGYNMMLFYYMDDRFVLAEGMSYSFDENGNYLDNGGLMLFDYKNNTRQFFVPPIFIPAEI